MTDKQGPTLADHWNMVERYPEPLDLDAAVAACAWMVSSNPLPLVALHGPMEIRDGCNNEADIDDVVEVVNHAPHLLLEVRRLREVASWAQAVLAALNIGDVQMGSPLHKKLREVMIDYRRQRDNRPKEKT